jgi:hypothetical protein
MFAAAPRNGRSTVRITNLMISWVGFWIGFLLFALPIYFAPTGIAFGRKHPQLWAIFALNLMAGWTMLGWVGTLVWSLLVTERKPAYVLREVAPGQFVPVELPDTVRRN